MNNRMPMSMSCDVNGCARLAYVWIYNKKFGIVQSFLTGWGAPLKVDESKWLVRKRCLHHYNPKLAAQMEHMSSLYFLKGI